MRYELYISLRYLKAKRKQIFISLITILSMAGVALGVMALVIVLSVMSGFVEDLKTKILGTNAHLVIMQHGSPLRDYKEIIRKVQGVEGIVATTPFIFSQAMLTSETNAHGIVLRGIDPDTAGRVINIQETLKKGSLNDLKKEEDSTGQPGIFIGKELAQNLGVLPDDTVVVVSPLGVLAPMGGSPPMKKFRVTGIFDSGMYEYDTSLAYISLKSAQKFLAMGDTVSGVEVKVKDIYAVKKIAQRIQKELGFPFWTKDWMQMNKSLFAALKLERTVMFIILVLIVLVAAFGIVSSLIMVVMEKNKDIAVLKSMGATGKSIMRIFIFEGLIIGVVGTIVGLIAGYTICVLLAQYQFISLPSDIYYISHLPVKMNIIDFFLVAFSAIGISFLATLYPSWEAAKLDPAEALRYE
ncbi:MAG: lipoprotein-releasing ABC transporter permease subunit [Deltaproteobacteria bacterium]|nr:lipoprotein-releasing ABC transporter permease subunit [Deltaproteobacteria bacterium]MDO9210734.1 lipoprotein-releasing ABC transporter permease subunit [Deltaproteobacteria bacterium]